MANNNNKWSVRKQALTLLIPIFLMISCMLFSKKDSGAIPTETGIIPNKIGNPEQTATPKTEQINPTSPINNTQEQIKLRCAELLNLGTDGGWTSYQVNCAVENTSSKSLLFSPYFSPQTIFSPESQYQYQPVLQHFTLGARESVVRVAEGNTYQPTITTLGDGGAYHSFIIPAGFLVTGIRMCNQDSCIENAPNALNISFRIPELLHPSTIEILPGGSIGDSQPVPMKIDLAKDLIKEFRVDPTRKLIEDNEEVSISQQLKASIKVSNQSSIDYLNSRFILPVDMTIKNADITGDQPLAINDFLVDENGWVYGELGRGDPNMNPKGCGSRLPNSIGPGLSETYQACFGIPLSLAFTKQFYFAIITDSTDELFIVKNIQKSYCQKPNDIYYAYKGEPLQSDQLINIPGDANATISRTIDEKPLLHRVQFKGQAGDQISLKIKFQPETNYSFDRFRYNIVGPFGEIISDPISIDSLLNGITFPVYCDGTYNIYLNINTIGIDEDISYDLIIK